MSAKRDAVQLERLRKIISAYESVLVAFSGGVDSAFVLKVSRDVLGSERVLAVTAKSEAVPARELEVAVRFARELDVRHDIIETGELDNPAYASNTSERCYHCKTGLYERLIPIAAERHLKIVCNGTNLDDLDDVRPGLKAASDHNVRSPLVEAELAKDAVRRLSRALGLGVWDKPASPCLSSRFPYGTEITRDKLSQVEAGEIFLQDLGFKVVRLRHFGSKACVELGQEEFVRVMDVALRNKIVDYIRSLGFRTVVLEPYESGRLNREPGAVAEPAGDAP